MKKSENIEDNDEDLGFFTGVRLFVKTSPLNYIKSFLISFIVAGIVYLISNYYHKDYVWFYTVFSFFAVLRMCEIIFTGKTLEWGRSWLFLGREENSKLWILLNLLIVGFLLIALIRTWIGK